MAQTRVGVRPRTSPTSTLLLDTYPGAVAAYSLRKLSSDYNGAVIKVRRMIDNQELDINFNGDELDIASLTSFCLNTDGYIVKWYDQSGNNYHAEQTILNTQPKIYDSVNGIITINGKNSIKFNGLNQYLTQTIPNFVGTTSLFGVSKITKLDQNTYWGNYGDSSYGACLGIVNGSVRIQTTTNTNVNYPKKFTTNFALETFIRDVSNTWTWYEQSISQGSKSLGGQMNLRSIGARIGGSTILYSDAHLCELIYYISDETNNKTSIETNINDYYSIY